jgi:DeoR/GlpR family transcriptional regulator of sugar metabolism
MLKDERQQSILDKLNTDKKVTLVALSQQMSVSYDSIRRDIIELEEMGLLKKVHGGAIANSYLTMKARQEMGIQNPEILSITKKALKIIESGQIILMDGGSTNLYIAEQLPKNIEITIVTNNPPLALSFHEHNNVEVILLGGKIHKRYQITTGQELSEQMKYLKVDYYFMGVVGAHPSEGLTLRDYEEANQKRKMIASARKVVACISSEKMNHAAPHRICGIEELDLLITSHQITPQDLEQWIGKVEIL